MVIMLTSALLLLLVHQAASNAMGQDAFAEVPFALTRAGRVSAGIVDSNGQMLTQLYTGRWMESGNHTAKVPIDLADISSGHKLVVISNAGVTYTWEGVIGNTGPITGPAALRGLNPPAYIVIVGNRAVWCLGYNERQSSCFTFNLSNPHVSVPVSTPNFERLYKHVAFDGKTVYLNNVGNGPEATNYYHLPETFVIGLDLDRRSNKTGHFCMHNFTAPGATTQVCSTGTSQPLPPWHCQTDGCISTSDPETFLALDFTRRNETVPPECNANKSWPGSCHYQAQPTGIAVQKNGSALLVSHAYETTPEVRLFHKVTGASLGQIPLPHPGMLVLTNDEKSFWTQLIGSGGSINRYAVEPKANYINAFADPEAAITGVPTGCSIAVHPTTNSLWVADRKLQQFRIFPATGGKADVSDSLWGASLALSFPYIANSSSGSIGSSPMVCSSIAFTEDGQEAWITDPQNRRIIRVDVKTEQILDTVMFMTVNYASAVDWNKPERVFCNFLEFEINYSVPLSPSTGWRLKRNWGTNAAPEYHQQIGLTHWSWAGFVAVITVNNRTIAQTTISPDDLSPVPADQENGEARLFVELMPDGTLRQIYEVPHGCHGDLHPDGSLRQVTFDRETNRTVVGIVDWDPAIGNWSFPFRTIANVSESPSGLSPHFDGDSIIPHALVMDVEVPSTPDDLDDTKKLLIILEGHNNPEFSRFHLGAIQWSNETHNQTSRHADGDWVWLASPGKNWTTSKCNVSMDNNGSNSLQFEDTCIVDPDGSLDRCGGHFPCAANKAMTVKGHIIYGFNGEGWHGAQANQWLHFDAVTGLFLGQFGVVNGIHDPAYSSNGWAAPGTAGNSFSGTLITTASDDVYLYHNDESAHGGIHRWKIEGLDDIERIAINI